MFCARVIHLGVRGWRERTAAEMTRQMIRPAALCAALCAALLLAALYWTTPAAAQSGQLTVSVDRSSVPAEGGSVTVTVRISADAIVDENEVTLTTDLGSFGADSGPSRVVVRPAAIEGDGEDAGTAEASVRLVGDGQPGLAVITARLGSLVDATTAAFIGAPAEVVILRPGPDRPLDAARAHLVQVEVRDQLGQPVPGAPLRLEASGGSEPMLRSAEGVGAALLALRTSERGRATATLRASPGDARLLAVSVEAEADLDLTLHGEPAQLLLRAVNSVLERGSETAFAIVLAQLIDEGGRAVPGREVSFAAEEESRIQLAVEGDPERPLTDAGGSVLARAHAQAAQSGSYWLRADAGELMNLVELTVVGKPETIYLTATPIDALEESTASVREYVLRAEVVDSAGRLAAPGYTVRWRVLLSGGESALEPERSLVLGGVAATRLRIENAEDPPRIQALLIERPEVETEGRLADLAAEGLALRTGLNVVTWIGEETTIDQAIAPIAHLETTVWREQPEDKGWLVYTTRADAPAAEPFAVEDGVRLHIRVAAAARLPGAAR